MVPPMATTNCTKSVSSTPRRPPSVVYRAVMPNTKSVTFQGSKSGKITPLILMAARMTVAMIMALKKTPR